MICSGSLCAFMLRLFLREEEGEELHTVDIVSLKIKRIICTSREDISARIEYACIHLD